MHDGFAFVPSLPGSDLSAVAHGEQQVSMPSLAPAGMQMLMTYDVSADDIQERGFHGHLVQSAAPVQARGYYPDAVDLVGQDAVSNPIVACAGGRFLPSWSANDGWPAHTNGGPETYRRSVPLRGPPHSSPLVDEGGGAPTGLVMQAGGGRMHVGGRCRVRASTPQPWSC